MITGINHAGLIVQDLDKEIAFYRDVSQPGGQDQDGADR